MHGQPRLVGATSPRRVLFSNTALCAARRVFFWAQTPLMANGTITAANPADNTSLVGYWAKRMRQAYWAATSFTDDNVGTVMSAAKAAGLYDSSVVVFWGDQ